MKKQIRTSHARNKFEGKIVLVTGASSGIGRQVSLDFSGHGLRVLYSSLVHDQN